MCCRFMRTKHVGALVPLLPLTWFCFVGYQADMALGNKMERILGK